MRAAPWTLALTVLVAPYQAQAQVPVPMALEVTLNGETRGTVLTLQRGTEFLVSRDDARSWRLRLPAQSDLAYRGQAFHSLSSLGLSVSRLDTGALQLELRAEPSAFESTTASLSGFEFRPTPAAWGGFASYDFVANQIEGVNAIDGAFTLSAFAPYGSLSHQFVERNLWSDGVARRDSIRIATTYRHTPVPTRIVNPRKSVRPRIYWSGSLRALLRRNVSITDRVSSLISGSSLYKVIRSVPRQ